MACNGGQDGASRGRRADWGRRPFLVAALVVLACLPLTTPAAAVGAGSARTRISSSGRIGRLRINTSTRARVIGLLGLPDYDTHGNIGQGAPRTPNYEELGYGCRPDQGLTVCAAAYYLNVRRQRLESFYTNSSVFTLPGGVARRDASWPRGAGSSAAEYRRVQPGNRGHD